MAAAEARLARDPLRNIVLLKHLQAYPGHARLHHVADGGRDGFLVVLDAAATSWDRRTYPAARFVALFAAQDHARDWLAPMLADGRAFACEAGPTASPRAVCFAYENWSRVWEIGGVFTPEAARRQGHGARTVRAVLGELGRRGHFPRYQVHERNLASIRLAQAAGLRPFLHLTHYAHTP